MLSHLHVNLIISKKTMYYEKSEILRKKSIKNDLRWLSAMS